MGKKRNNRKKNKNNSQASDNSRQTMLSSNAYKHDKGRDKPIGSLNEVRENGYQDGNPTGKSKFGKHNIPYLMHTNVDRESSYEIFAPHCDESYDEPSTSDFFTSDNSRQTMLSSNAYKHDKGRDKPIGSLNEVRKNGYQDGNPTGKSKFEKHNIPYLMLTNMDRESSYEIFAPHCDESYDEPSTSGFFRSDNSRQSMLSSNAYKHDKGRDKPIGSSNEVRKNGYQDGNPTGKSKFGKHNIPYLMHTNVDQESSYEIFAPHCDESYDEPSTSGFFKPAFEDQCKSKNLKSKNNFKGKVMKERIFSSVNQYKNSKISFSKIYQRWLPDRQSTLKKLRSLLEEIHDHTNNYYKTQAMFKEFSFNSRSVKEVSENQAIDFFASFAAFVSDAASGITSFAQAFEMDSYQTKFQEIMDHDAEITKDLYASRSQCISEYEGIEEVIRRFHPNTFTSTVGEISDTLHVDKHLSSMKNAYEQNDMSKLLDEVCEFFNNACQTEVLENVGASVNRYVTDNPAAFEACKSTGKAVYGAIDTFAEKKRDRNSAIGYVDKATNLYLMLEDKKEVDHLKSLIHEDNHRSKLEIEIEEAIDSFEKEETEMKKIYFKLFNIYE